MCFASGFQQNHISDLQSLVALVLSARESGQKPYVNLDILTAASLMQRIVAPVRLLALIELAKREISGRFELTEECEACEGEGENESYTDDPEDMGMISYKFVSCSSCDGTGHHLSIETKRYFGLLDRKSRVAALARCKLSYFEAQLILRRFSRKTPAVDSGKGNFYDYK